MPSRELFADSDGHFNKCGYKAMGGQIINASVVSVPEQRNRRDENEKIKKREVATATKNTWTWTLLTS